MTLNKVYRRAALALVASLAIGACSDTDIESPGSTTAPPVTPPPSPPAGPTIVPDVVLSGGITSDTRISAGDIVELSGKVVVGGSAGITSAGFDKAAVDGVTLTIEPGATFYGETTEDYLVVAAGANIEAIGTLQQPITFTSLADLEATEAGTPRDASSTASGEWGGLVINGLAPINACDGDAEGGDPDCQKEGEGASGLFGGEDDNDTSGRLSYVRVLYAGSNPSETNQLNGIAFQGVGRNTQVDHIQVHNNLDDGVEFFGGTVNAKYVVITGPGDDGIDWTDGWTGNLQFAVVKQAAGVGERGIEADNLELSPESSPRSMPSLSNLTLIGGGDAVNNNDTGMVLRRGTAGTIANAILLNWPDAGIDVDGDDTDADTTSAQVAAGNLIVTSIFSDNADDVEDTDEDDYQGFATLTELFDDEGFVIVGDNVAGDDNTLTDEFFPGDAELAVDAYTAFDNPNFFQVNGEDIDYIGAFGPDETKDANWAAGWTFALFAEEPGERALCPTGTISTTTFIGGKEICQLRGTLTSDVTLTDGDELLYELDGRVIVGEDVGGDFFDPDPNANTARLTINPGVTIFGRTTEDYLVVARGSTIFANGTSSAPITFTSSLDVQGLADVDADVGKWGGLVINGRAPINACDGDADGGDPDCEKEGEGASGLFGGNGEEDTSGRLRYVRVLYAGSNPSETNQLNGIAFQGVGNDTEVDFVQVHNNLDDGVEFFGGTVNAKHIVISGAGDDGFDWTDGWTGKVQYLIVHQSPLRGERGIEADNLELAPESTPRSSPTIANFTLVGGNNAVNNNDTGAVLRRGTAGRIVNGVIVNWPDAGIDVDGDDTDQNTTEAQIAADALIIDAIFSDTGDDLESDDEADDFAGFASLELLLASKGFTIVGDDVFDDDNTLSGADLSIYPGSGFGYIPNGAENALTAHDLSDDDFFDNVDYIGAVENTTDTWYAGWTVTVE